MELGLIISNWAGAANLAGVMGRDEHGALTWPRVAASCDYRGSARFEDIVDIELRIERVAGDAVFDDDTRLGHRTELLCGEQKEIWGGLAACDLRGAEDVRIEERQQPGQQERVADPIEVAVRSDAARRR